MIFVVFFLSDFDHVQVSFIGQLRGKEGFPQLLVSGSLENELAQGISEYMVISPMGQLLGEDTDPDLVQQVFLDISLCIKELCSLGILHRCVFTAYRARL